MVDDLALKWEAILWQAQTPTELRAVAKAVLGWPDDLPQKADFLRVLYKRGVDLNVSQMERHLSPAETVLLETLESAIRGNDLEMMDKILGTTHVPSDETRLLQTLEAAIRSNDVQTVDKIIGTTHIVTTEKQMAIPVEPPNIIVNVPTYTPPPTPTPTRARTRKTIEYGEVEGKMRPIAIIETDS